MIATWDSLGKRQFYGDSFSILLRFSEHGRNANFSRNLIYVCFRRRLRSSHHLFTREKITEKSQKREKPGQIKHGM